MYTKKNLQHLLNLLEAEAYPIQGELTKYKAIEVKMNGFILFTIQLSDWCEHGKKLGFFYDYDLKHLNRGITLDANIFPALPAGFTNSGRLASEHGRFFGSVNFSGEWDLTTFFQDVAKEHLNYVVENWEPWTSGRVTLSRFEKMPDILKCFHLDSNEGLKKCKWFEGLKNYINGTYTYPSRYLCTSLRYWASWERERRGFDSHASKNIEAFLEAA